jgi:hypothetical protein
MQLPHQDMAAWSSCPWKKRFTGRSQSLPTTQSCSVKPYRFEYHPIANQCNLFARLWHRHTSPSIVRMGHLATVYDQQLIKMLPLVWVDEGTYGKSAILSVPLGLHVNLYRSILSILTP